MYFDAGSANCVKCHGTTTLGDGQPEVEDKWSEIVRMARLAAEQDKDNSAKKLAIIDEYSLPKRWNRPRNLLSGIYRGGRRPIDLYYRIVAGINGSGMPAHNTALKTEKDRWAVIAYVLSLPYDKDGGLGFDDSPTGPDESPR
ncbi:MAG: c-type cytochrome [Pirellulales bacterium]